MEKSSWYLFTLFLAVIVFLNYLNLIRDPNFQKFEQDTKEITEEVKTTETPELSPDIKNLTTFTYIEPQRS